MKTEILKIDPAKPDKAAIAHVAAFIVSGGLVVMPTDTVYGLAVSAFDRAAQKRIYDLKGRSFHKPLIIMPPDIAGLAALAEVTERTRKLMEDFWPGPLTLILPTHDLGRMVMGGRKDLGCRIPESPFVHSLLRQCRCPLATTSANPSGQPSATTAAQAIKYFDGKVDLIVDAGACGTGKPSTVLDLTHFHCVVVREGCLPSKKLLKYVQ